MTINGISPGLGPLTATAPSSAKRPSGQFGEVLGRAIDSLNELQQTADAASLDVATGGPTEIHEAMIAVQEAQLGFQVALQVRNKLIESYQEIMRMPV